MQLPWETMTTHYVVPGNRVVSLRVETVQCIVQLGFGEIEFPNQEDFRRNG